MCVCFEFHDHQLLNSFTHQTCGQIPKDYSTRTHYKSPPSPFYSESFPKCLTLIFMLDYFIMNETSGWEEAAAFCNFQQRNTKIQLSCLRKVWNWKSSTLFNLPSSSASWSWNMLQILTVWRPPGPPRTSLAPLKLLLRTDRLTFKLKHPARVTWLCSQQEKHQELKSSNCWSRIKWFQHTHRVNSC